MVIKKCDVGFSLIFLVLYRCFGDFVVVYVVLLFVLC